MKHVQACLSARKDGDLSFHNRGCPVKLVQTCLYAGNNLHFHRRGGAVKHVQACLSARKSEEISFLQCGGPVKLVQSCLCAGNTL